MRKRFAVLLFVLLLFASCAPQPSAEEGLRLWYPAVDGASALSWETLPADAATPDAAALAERLLAAPQSPNLSSPFPHGVRLLGCVLEDGVLTVRLSEEYGALTGIERTVGDACLTLTLTQLDDATAVCVTVEGEPVTAPRTPLYPTDFLLSGAGEEPVYVTAVLYFPRLEGRGLGVEHRSVLVPEGNTVSGAIAAAFLTGPEGDALRTLLPPGTELIEVSVTDRVCTVNLSAPFLGGMGGDQNDAHLLVYSLVDTLGNLDNISSVQLLVEGEPLPDLPGIPLSRPLEPDFRLTED